MGSTIKLIFQTILAGSGLAEVNRQTQDCQRKLAKLGQGFSALSTHLGNLGGVAGRAMASLCQGSVYAAAAQVIGAIGSKVVDLCKHYRKLAQDAKLAARGLSAEWFTAEHAHKQYAKHVEEWHEKARRRRDEAEAAARKAEDDAKAAAAEKEKYYNEETKVLTVEQQIAALREKEGLYSKDELTRLRTKIKLMLQAADANVAAKDRALKHAVDNGSPLAGADAEASLARAQRESTEKEAQRMLDAYNEAKRAAKERAQAEKEAAEEAVEAQMESMRREDEEREENQKKREAAEKKIADIRKAAAEAVQRIEGQIAAAKKAGEEWGQAAGRARGKNFGDWDRGERDRAKDEANAERRQRSRERNVDAEIEKIEKTSPMARSKWAKERLRKLRQWKEFQDDENNPGNAVNDLEKQKQEILDKSERHLAAIENCMKNLGL